MQDDLQLLQDPPPERVGYAIVGLGQLALGQLLPAFGMAKHSRVVALVSGDRNKAQRVAHQYGIRQDAIYGYDNYDRLAANPEVQAVYIALPNNMHAEYTVRGAQAGKHILCEKPMAMNVPECGQMIGACKKADRKLMIAYRVQYEPMARMVMKMVRDGRFGDIKEFISGNSMNQDNPDQWRLRRAPGGGPLPDMGIYCINTARFLSGEEPVEVIGDTYSTPQDRRFTEVEESAHFILLFQSGLRASCITSFGSYRSHFFQLLGSDGWAEMNPAYAYSGLRLRLARRIEDRDTIEEPQIDPINQFTREIDHMSRCVQRNVQPYTPGEEGMQDQRIIEAIYESALTGSPVKLGVPAQTTRGPEPEE